MFTFLINNKNKYTNKGNCRCVRIWGTTLFFNKKSVYKKLSSNWSLNPENQSGKLNFFKKLEKNCVLSRSESLFSFQNICFYTLIMGKILNFITALLWIKERNWILYCRIAGSQDPSEIRNFSETLLVNLGPILKKRSRSPKA